MERFWLDEMMLDGLREFVGVLGRRELVLWSWRGRVMLVLILSRCLGRGGGGWWKTGVRMLSRESRVWGLVGRRGAVKT